ncbi:hypothetical protein Mapa_016463 [Marchantia paleacea]|nr:hypothetical protein Mapa_016463 [Marchantia paleacea]
MELSPSSSDKDQRPWPFSCSFLPSCFAPRPQPHQLRWFTHPSLPSPVRSAQHIAAIHIQASSSSSSSRHSVRWASETNRRRRRASRAYGGSLQERRDGTI